MNSYSKQMTTEALYERINRMISTFKHPTLKRNLTMLKALHYNVQLDGTLHIELVMPFAWQSGFEELQKKVSTELLWLTGATVINWQLINNIVTIKPINDHPRISGVHNLIAISSCKGGVGKSSTAVNLALALVAEGGRVGLLDADIYGPSIPTMLGTNQEQPKSPDGQHMAPIMAYGLATNSIGYMATDYNAMIWRGPMASKALLQLLTYTLWPELDYLILDMPPGTGDIQLTLVQSMPVTGVLIVTTPQDVALADAHKSILMFAKVGIPILGIVENMSMYTCRYCGHGEAIFGAGGAKKLAEQYQCALLGQLPLHITLRDDLDRGEPTIVSRPESEFAKIYRQLAGEVAAQLYWQGEIIPTDIAFKNI